MHHPFPRKRIPKTTPCNHCGKRVGGGKGGITRKRGPWVQTFCGKCVALLGITQDGGAKA